MTIPTSDATRRRIVESAKNPTKLRLAAFREMVRPSVAFLIRLEKDPALPHKLMIEVVRRREEEMLIRQIVPKAGNTATPRESSSKGAARVMHSPEATLQRIAEDPRHSSAGREAARNELSRLQNARAFDEKLEALLEGKVKRKDADPHVHQAYDDLEYPRCYIFGGRLNFDYPGYFDRLTKLHAETSSERVRAKAEEAIVYFTREGNPEIKTLASEALARLRRVEGPAQAKAANP